MFFCFTFVCTCASNEHYDALPLVLAIALARYTVHIHIPQVWVFDFVFALFIVATIFFLFLRTRPPRGTPPYFFLLSFWPIKFLLEYAIHHLLGVPSSLKIRSHNLAVNSWRSC